MSTFKSLNEEGKSFVSKQDWLSAFLTFTKLLTLENSSASEKSISFSNRSYVLLKMSKFENSKKDALRAIESNPKWFKGYLRAGNVCLAVNEVDDALKYYKEGFGKEEENGFLGKLYSEVYFKHKFQTRLRETHKLYEVLQDFKENFFSNRSKAMIIYENLHNGRLGRDGNLSNIDNIERVIQEMHVILFENLDFRGKAVEEIKKGQFYYGNLCLWVLYQKEKNSDVKAKLLEEMRINFVKETFLFPKNAIKYHLSNIPALKSTFSIDLKDVVNCFWKHMQSHYYYKFMKTQYYFIKEVKNDGKEWIMDLDSGVRSPSTFYDCGDAQRSKTYYWKYFTMNACSFINGCLASVVQELLKEGIMPYLTYKDNGKDERIDLICPTIMELIVKKNFINPWIYYNNTDCWFHQLRGRNIGASYMNFIFGHTVIVFLTKKIVQNQNLSFFVNLTAFQYDIYSYSSNGYPFFEKPMLSSEDLNDEFFFGKVVETVQEFKTPRFAPKTKGSFQYFPLDSWMTVEKNTLKDVKNFLKID